jgi:DNA-binding transcriptional regulator YdaS (Cro superfamily)
MLRPKNLQGIALAIERAGGQTSLAAQIGVTQSAVSKWFYAGYIPRLHKQAVADLTGIPVGDLERKTKRKKSNGK